MSRPSIEEVLGPTCAPILLDQIDETRSLLASICRRVAAASVSTDQKDELFGMAIFGGLESVARMALKAAEVRELEKRMIAKAEADKAAAQPAPAPAPPAPAAQPPEAPPTRIVVELEHRIANLDEAVRAAVDAGAAATAAEANAEPREVKVISMPTRTETTEVERGKDQKITRTRRTTRDAQSA